VDIDDRSFGARGKTQVFETIHQAAMAALPAGLSIVIPEWDNVEQLEACLESVFEAARRWTEPVEVIVIVNGSPPAAYSSLRLSYPTIRWQFYRQPLGFSGAIGAGLRIARFAWVYLLNSDAVLDADALNAAGACRNDAIFAIGSQILLQDATRFRDETNWTTLFIENGLATIHDLIPQSSDIVDSFYAGGGASLFQTRLLHRFLDVAAYDPFYWEDVEWGWRARKLGLCVRFCRTLWRIASSRLWNHLAPVPDEDMLTRTGPLLTAPAIV
jgi:GT2 family glycosyltransferase